MKYADQSIAHLMYLDLWKDIIYSCEMPSTMKTEIITLIFTNKKIPKDPDNYTA